MSITTDATSCGPDAVVVRVEGPDDRSLSATDARSLFPEGSPTARALRLHRLQTCPRVVATIGGRVVGLATCRQVDREMRVLDFAVRLPSRRVAGDGGVAMLGVFHALLDVIELASTAGGCDRVLVYPPRVPCRTLERRGYVVVDEGDARPGWKKWLWPAYSSRRKSGGCESGSG